MESEDYKRQAQREDLSPFEAAMIVALKQAEDSKSNRCGFLRTFLNCWLVFEVFLWAFFFASAVFYEITYIEKIDLLDFSDEIETWYFRLIYGDVGTIDQKLRSYIVLINFILVLVFVTYMIFALILLYGINKKKLLSFIPYIVLDAVIIFSATFGCILGFITSYQHLFCMSLIFLVVRSGVELCVVLLFIKYRKITSASSVEPMSLDTLV